VVGCGASARRIHLPAYRELPDVEVVAFHSRSLSSAEAAAAEHGEGRVVADVAELLAADDIDAVSVCTPNALHAPIALAAMAQGKHVLVDKPMATSVADADHLVRAARENGVVLVPAHTGRFISACDDGRQRIAAGAVGRVVAIEGVLQHAGPDQWAQDTGTFMDRKLSGGGALLDLGVHLFDLLPWLVGDQISSVAFCALDQDGDVEWAGQADLLLRSGARGRVQVSWRAPASHFEVRVTGTDGELVIGPSPPIPGGGVFSMFRDAALGRTAPAITAEDGRQAVAAAMAAYDAAATGAPVPLP
jgi:predicted dehydrogenase